MKNFFKPTKVTWWVGVFLYFLIILLATIHPFFLVPLVIPALFLDQFFSIIFNISLSNTFGSFFIYFSIFILLYIFASIISFLWYKFKPIIHKPD